MPSRIRRGAVGMAIGVVALTVGFGQPVGAGDAKGSPPQTSIYDLGLKVTTSDGRILDLAQLRGKVAIYAMFFATCPGICPMMTRRLQDVEDHLTIAQRERLQVVMVSFDDSDSPERLRAYAKAHAVSTQRWVLARGGREVTRALSEFLGMPFEKRPEASYAHEANVVLLDADGAIIASVPNSSLDDPRFTAFVRSTLD